MKCSICGGTGFRESRQCPAHGGKTVCISCCYKCSYHAADWIACRYYTNSPEAKILEEIAQKKKRAAFLKKTSERLWAKGMNYVASQREAEWRAVLKDIRKMEEDLNEGRN